MNIQPATYRVYQFHDLPPDLLFIGDKVMGIVVTQLDFVIPMRDKDSADRGAGMGRTDFLTGLETLNHLPSSSHYPHTSIIIPSSLILNQGGFIRRGENLYMGDFLGQALCKAGRLSAKR